jgi:hypothetical protein
MGLYAHPPNYVVHYIVAASGIKPHVHAPSPLGGIAVRAEEEKPLHTRANFFIPTLLCHCVRALALVRRDGGTTLFGYSCPTPASVKLAASGGAS